MNHADRAQSTARRRKSMAYLCLLLSSCLIAACSVPNLEQGACAESRIAVREFYSFHFGNDMKFSAENLKLRERFITAELTGRAATATDGTDPFTTGTEDLPKAFRVAECMEKTSDRTDFRVLLFWRDDFRSEQKEITVDAVKQDEKWMVNKIEQKTVQ